MDTFYYGLSGFQKCDKKRLTIPTSVLIPTDTPAYQLCHLLSIYVHRIDYNSVNTNACLGFRWPWSEYWTIRGETAGMNLVRVTL